MKVIPVILILFTSSLNYGQTSESALFIQLDSLKSELKLSRNDSLRANLLLQLTSNYSRTNPDSAIHYGEQAFDHAKSIGNNKIAVIVLGFIGDAYHSKGNLPKGLEVCLEAIALNKELPDSLVNSAGPAFSTLGDIYTDVGNYRQAFSFYNTLLVNPPSNDRRSLSFAFGHFGRANVYEKMNMLDSALYELELSKINFSESRLSGGKLFPNVYPVAPNWFNLRSRVYAKQGKIDLALRDLNTTLNMTLKTDAPYYSSNSYNDIASLYANLNSQDSAIYFAKKGLQEANRISYVGGILAASEILASQFESVNDTEALYYLKLANRMRDQLYGTSNIQLMKDMITQNENKQREVESAKIESRNRIRLNTLLGSLFTLLVVALLLFRNNRMKQKAKQKIEKAYDLLKSTQSQLIQSEKMASLGELTAGIAHEIQNPLNFVNNFSELNRELITELNEEVEKGNLGEIKSIANDIAGNEEKILHHGLRASGIVKSMLEHSRTGDGNKELTDLNKLAEEFLRLAYHGFRAKDHSPHGGQAGFIVDFNLDLEEKLPKIKVISQDIGRVLLNLINNAFYACADRIQSTVAEAQNQAKKGNEYKPEVIVSTKLVDKKVEIRVKDNGEGIPEEIRDKIFQPFFTTKPTGDGTGLGLSLSYDIITKGHSGELSVETEQGRGSEFIIRLPIDMNE